MKKPKSALLIKILCLAVCCALCAEMKAEEKTEEKTHNRFGMNGALTSSSSWLLEFSYHYMFNNYIGLGGSAGTWKVYFEEGWASGKNWSIDDDYNKPWNVYIRPSVILRTPSIKYRACSWSLFVEPGVMLNVPYQRVCINTTPHWPAIEPKFISTTKGQWLAVDLRVGVNLDYGPCSFSAGYLRSNLDVYSQRRHLSYNGISFEEFYPAKPTMRGAYLSCSYNF